MKYLSTILRLFVGLFIVFICIGVFDVENAYAELGAYCAETMDSGGFCPSGEKCWNNTCIPDEAREQLCGDVRGTDHGSCGDNERCQQIETLNPRTNEGTGRFFGVCMPGASPDTDAGGREGGVQGYDEWRQRQIDAANSVDRGIFTEGLSTECMAFGECRTCDILKVVGNVFGFAFQIVGIVAVAVITMGGFAYVRSGGNEETAGAAKKIITAAVLGTLVIFAAWAIINTILNLTGFNVGGGTWWNPSCS